MDVPPATLHGPSSSQAADRTFAVELYYDDCPPSLNTIGTRGSHWAVNNAKKMWQGLFERLLMSSKLPRKVERIEAEAWLRFPLRRRRDEDNARWLLSKALGDALANGGWLSDDTPDRFVLLRVHFEEDPGPKRTRVVLRATV